MCFLPALAMELRQSKSMLPTAMAQVIAGASCLQHAKRLVTLCYHTRNIPQAG
jgi:hypothetical protein